jgi:hypothetical protein
VALAPRRLAVALAAVLLAGGVARAAGDVVLAQSGNRLTVQGDAAANTIEITSAGTPEAFVVTGLAGTTVGGVAGAIVAGVRRIAVSTGDGADRVELRQVAVRGKVTIRLGKGDDAVLVDRVRLRGSLTVRGGAGLDDVRVEGSRVGQRVWISTARDPDTVLLTDVTLEGGLTLFTGNGDDLAVLTFVDTRRHADARILTGDGEDEVWLQASDFDDDVDVDLGDDDDDLRLVDSDFEDEAVFDGGRDDDVLRVGGSLFFDRDERVDIHDFEHGI